MLNKKKTENIVVVAVSLYTFAYAIGAIWLLFDGWLNNFSSITWLWGEDTQFPQVIYFLLFTIIGSLLGSALLGLTSFHRYKAIEKSFELDHSWGYFFLPVLALIVGILVFSLIQAGLFVLAGDISGDKSPESATLGYLAIGGVAGYNWDVFIKKLQELSVSVLNTQPKG
ncbi:hypothetical protein [Vibrio splendidus]|uniref:hypothetical protein n=1 Tax=Vibrio splendidus TaxID=29497 RepID=UPI00021C2F1E|nr:hypothetical protein [Vibrio splendidus]EGU38031.1 hypothetical protein VISP3789_16883 [Vibrio splendidus ATCC 33789]